MAEVEKLVGSESPLEIGQKINEIIEKGVGGGAGLQLFDTILKDHILTYKESKGLALQGTYVYKEAVAGSRYGYPDFYNKCLDEYQKGENTKQWFKSNVEYIGDVIDDKGFLSGFASSIYPTLPDFFSPGNDTWEFVTKITTGDLSSISVIIGDTAAYKSGIGLYIESSVLKLMLSGNGTSANIANAIKGSTLLANTTYWFKVEFTGTEYNVYYSLDGADWNLDITVSNSTVIYQGSYKWVLGTGCIAGSTWYYNTANLDLHKSYMNINGERWWNGVEYLEYNKNSNGHLFYDISQKIRVDNIFESSGMAWMYGIDQENERIFLPRNIWFDQMSMDEVGKAIEAGLPNVWGAISGCDTAGLTAADLGAFKHIKSTKGGLGDGTDGAYSFDASRCSPIYGNSDTVQPNAVKKLLYICVGNTEAQSSVTDVVDVTTTENDTTPLFAGMYFDFTPNNVSWLKAGEQKNSSGVYTFCYNELVNELNSPKYNLKVINQADMISGVDYSEYWVVNQDEMTFKAPTKSGITAEQPTAQLYFKVANAVQNLELLDAGKVLETLSNKISRHDCASYVTETYKNGSSWYRVYSDGYCEQVITSTYIAADKTLEVDLLKEYNNTDYFVIPSELGTTINDKLSGSYTFSKHISSITVYNNGYGVSTHSLQYKICGYIT